MNRPIAMAVVLGVVAAAPAVGQQASQMIVPHTPPTAAQDAALNAIRDVRDSVVAANALLAGLQRDLAQQPAASLEEQARRIAAQCTAAERQRVDSRKRLAEQTFPEKGMQDGQRGMLASMDQLKKPLATCRTTWEPMGKPGKGEEVRGYGVSRSRPIVNGFNDFERKVLSQSKKMKLDPRAVVRAGPSPADAPAPIGVRPPTAP